MSTGTLGAKFASHLKAVIDVLSEAGGDCREDPSCTDSGRHIRTTRDRWINVAPEKRKKLTDNQC